MSYLVCINARKISIARIPPRLAGNAGYMGPAADEQQIKDDIVSLEADLDAARSRLSNRYSETGDAISSSTSGIDGTGSPRPALSLSSVSHILLLLSDSALPLGSFAFSSGLESYLAHRPSRPAPSIYPFLALSLSSVAGTTLPYLLAAHRAPSLLPSLDDTLDACTLCLVARRASIAQGRALLTLWERAFRGTVPPGSSASLALAGFSEELKSVGPGASECDGVNGHYAPIWAVVTSAMGISVHESAYAYLFNHAKAVVSAAVRASVMGPYQAQGVLAGAWLRDQIARGMRAHWEVKVEDAGQVVPLMDLWIGRHEMLYSRIFNS